MFERGRPSLDSVRRAYLLASAAAVVAIALVTRIAVEQATTTASPSKPGRTPMDPRTLAGVLDIATVCYFACIGLGGVWVCTKGLLTRQLRVVAWPLPASDSAAERQPLAAMVVASSSPPMARRRVAASTASYLDTPEAFSSHGDRDGQVLNTVVVIAGLSASHRQRDSEFRPPLMALADAHRAIRQVQRDDTSSPWADARAKQASSEGGALSTRCAVCKRALRSNQRVSALRACAHVSNAGMLLRSPRGTIGAAAKRVLLRVVVFGVAGYAHSVCRGLAGQSLGKVPRL